MAVIRTYQLSVFGNYENSSNIRSVHHPYTYFSSMSQSCDLRIKFGQSSSFESYQHVSFYLRSLYINSSRVSQSCKPLRKIQSKCKPSIASVYLVPFVGHTEHHFDNSYLSTSFLMFRCPLFMNITANHTFGPQWIVDFVKSRGAQGQIPHLNPTDPGSNNLRASTNTLPQLQQ